MSAHAATLLFPGTRALTHCNAGGLATGGYGTAVGALRAAWEAGSARARARRRDAAAAPGRAADGVGARGGGHPAHGDRRLCGRLADGARGGATRSSPAPTGSPRTATPRTRSARTRSPCSPPTTAIPLYVVAPSSTVDLATPSGRRHPDRGARRGGGDGRVSPRATRRSTSRRRSSSRRSSPSTACTARPTPSPSPGRSRHEGDHPRGRVRDAAASADRLDRQAAPAGRRPADARLGLRQGRGGRRPRSTSSRTRGSRPSFEKWARLAARASSSTTTARSSNEDRLGAIGDIASCSSATGVDDDLLVIAGDNLFDFALPNMAAFWEMKSRAAPASAVAVYDCGRPGAGDALRRRRGRRRRSGRRVRGEAVGARQRRSSRPRAYLYHRAHVPLIERYLAEGNPPDQPGRLVAWLLRAGARVRLPLRRRVVRHREPRAAARGRQPLARAARAAAAGRVLDAELARRPAADPAAAVRAGSAGATSSASRAGATSPTSSRSGGRGRSCPSGTTASSAVVAAERLEPCALEVTHLRLFRDRHADADASYRVSGCCSTCCCRAAAWSARSRGPPLCAACATALPRLAPPLCARCGAPVAWPVRAAASARAGGSPSPPPGPRSSTTRASARSSPRWKERGLRGLALLAAELVVEVVPRPSRTPDHVVPPDGERSLERGHHPPLRLARELGEPLGAAGRGVPRPDASPTARSVASPGSSASGTSEVLSAPRGASGAASCSSTTSTRPARRCPPRRPPCVLRGRRRSR